MLEENSSNSIGAIGSLLLAAGLTVAINNSNDDDLYAHRPAHQAHTDTLDGCLARSAGVAHKLLLALKNRPELAGVFTGGKNNDRLKTRATFELNEDQTCSVSLSSPSVQCTDANVDGTWEVASGGNTDSLEDLQASCNEALRDVIN